MKIKEKIMINEDLMLMFTIRGFLLANKEENLAESLKLFVNRHPEIFEDKPEVIEEAKKTSSSSSSKSSEKKKLSKDGNSHINKSTTKQISF